MVRTRADAMVSRVSGAKAPRKNLGGSTGNNSDKNKGREYTGGNPYCPRETPVWQKPITSFFDRPPESRKSTESEEQQTESMSEDSEEELDYLEAGPSTSGPSTSGASTSRPSTSRG